MEPEFRRKGTASGLLALAQDYCAGQGVSEFTLLTGEENRTARAFYESRGFRLTGEVHYGKEL